MPRIPHLPRPARRRILNKARKTGEALVIRRALIVVNVAAGRAASDTAEAVGCAKSHVYDILAGFEKEGWAALLDGRRSNGVGGMKKTSGLFVEMLEKLEQHYSKAKRIHVILDNYGIHKSRNVASALARLPRIRLHFLPPYCPDENRIERVWLDLHANVTRNHRCPTLLALCAAVATYLNYVSPWTKDANDARPPLRATP